jgi:hypothetical protein
VFTQEYFQAHSGSTKRASSSPRILPPTAVPEALIKRYMSPIGIIQPGDNLELKDKHERNPNHLHSSNVIRVKHIITLRQMKLNSEDSGFAAPSIWGDSLTVSWLGILDNLY